eukprot:jgi/Tetstr1/466454/TSEL_010982.t1
MAQGAEASELEERLSKRVDSVFADLATRLAAQPAAALPAPCTEPAILANTTELPEGGNDATPEKRGGALAAATAKDAPTPRIAPPLEADFVDSELHAATLAEYRFVACLDAYASCANTITEAVVNIKFDEEPKSYAAYRELFEPLCGRVGPSRPVLTEITMVSRNAGASLTRVGACRCHERLGVPATQWITVYNAHRPMKQRYHYNVANTRVERGNDDGGLCISSVAWFTEL